MLSRLPRRRGRLGGPDYAARIDARELEGPGGFDIHLVEGEGHQPSVRVALDCRAQVLPEGGAHGIDGAAHRVSPRGRELASAEHSGDELVHPFSVSHGYLPAIDRVGSTVGADGGEEVGVLLGGVDQPRCPHVVLGLADGARVVGLDHLLKPL